MQREFDAMWPDCERWAVSKSLGLSLFGNLILQTDYECYNYRIVIITMITIIIISLF